ncbi:MAG TPA: ABC transporter substrate-binding protein [Polyangiaceae bacterium]|nr:ABC transporter substrate-binding protein [Polyangiaceae bacterium]
MNNVYSKESWGMTVAQVLALATAACGAFACSSSSGGGDPGTSSRGTLLFKNISCVGDGPTCDIGVPYDKGLADYVRETNKSNGFGGYQVNLVSFNANYDHNAAQAQIESWRAASDYKDVLGMFVWGTPESNYYHQLAQKDEKVSISSSYAGQLATPIDAQYTNSEGTKQSPGGAYSFFAGTDYSTTIRAAVQFMKDSGAKKVAFFYCEQTDFCYAPIPAGKDYAKDIGLTVGDDYRAHIAEFDAYTADLTTYFQKNPDIDWAWCGNATTSCALLQKALVAAGANTKMVFNTYGFDEETARICGEACTSRKNTYGILPIAPFGDLTLPGMETVVTYHGAGRQADSDMMNLYTNVRYVQGHVSGLMIKLALDQLQTEGREPTGKGIKEKLESFRNQSTAELSEPLTFTATDHRPGSTARIYAVNSSGFLTFEKNVSLNLKPEWLGW